MISIIVPVYNVEQYLNRCIQSILNQTYTDFELLLVDDGSPDSSPKLCDDWQKKDNRIRVFHKKNGGLSHARNFGINKAKGDYLTFIDSDDFVHHQYLEILFHAISQDCSDIAMLELKRFKSISEINESELNINDVQSKIYKNNDVLNLLGGANDAKFVVSCAKLYKRSIFNTCRFDLNRIHEDEFAVHRIFYEATLISVIDFSGYYYCMHEASLTHTEITNKRFLDKIDAYESRIIFFKSKNELELYYKSIIIYLTKIPYFIKKYEKNINKSSIKHVKNKYKEYFVLAKKLDLLSLKTHLELYIFYKPYLKLFLLIYYKVSLLFNKKNAKT